MKTYFRLRLIGVMLGVYALGATACETEGCTTDSCNHAVEIHVTAAAWLMGDYTVGVTTPERAFTCSLSLPELDSEGSAGAAGQTASSGSRAHCTQTAGPAAEQWEFPSIDFDRGFRINLDWETTELELTLHYEGQELLEERLIPTYTPVLAKGPDCPEFYRCSHYTPTLEARSPSVR